MHNLVSKEIRMFEQVLLHLRFPNALRGDLAQKGNFLNPNLVKDR